MYQYNLGQLFRYVAKNNREKTALILGEKKYISYAELECKSNQLANYLISYGVRRCDVIAIQNSKSKIGFAMMLACLKLGVIYTNFDYTNPGERIRKIFSAARPELVFADQYNADISHLCMSIECPYVAADDPQVIKEIEGQKPVLPEDLLISVSSNNPAYIMFTSGSTGIPKGVVISHRSLLNFIAWGKDTYGLKSDDVMTNINPVYFDNSVFDFYCSVFNGITMAAVPKEMTEKPREMLQFLDEVGCTFWFSVPSMLVYLTNLKLLSKEVLQSIRIFSFGGEGYPKELLRKLYDIYKSTADFYNVYGPTEGTCICSAYKITEEDMAADGLAPLGQIAPNFDYVILDENDCESSLGELCLMGDQLALGYYNDEERTNKSFVPYRIRKAYYEKMYRTGDLVERVDGKLYFRGRIDNQIKHMGYRIELEEIESALIRIEGMKECAVVHTLSRNNLSKIMAYVVMEERIDSAVLRQELKKYLPGYMIPNNFEFMDMLPKNANGKIDRVKLKNLRIKM